MPFEDYLIQQFTLVVSQYGYVAIGLLAFLECSLFVGLFVPGESFVILGGLFANQGALNLWLVYALVILAGYGGDVVGYLLGERFGEQTLMKVGKRFGYKEEHFLKAHAFFERWGILAIIAGRFLSVFRSLLPATIGTVKYPRHKFLLFDAVGVILWSITFVTLGYILGESWRVVSGYATIISAATFILGFIIVYYIFKKKTKKKQSTETPSQETPNR